MKYLVTGHKGYIGSRLFKELQDTGYDVIGLDIKDGHDICTCELPDVDVVYHLAAQAGAIPSMEDPMHDARMNILGTIRIAKHYGKTARIIYATSGGALDPESPYGLSKRTGEHYLNMLARQVVILRFSSIYGDKPRGVVDNFIRDEVPTVYGDGSAVRDFVHVDDIVRGLVFALGWYNGEYSMGSGVGTSVKEIADATGKEINYQPARAGEKHYAVLENTAPDWKPHIDVLDYVSGKN